MAFFTWLAKLNIWTNLIRIYTLDLYWWMTDDVMLKCSFNFKVLIPYVKKVTSCILDITARSWTSFSLNKVPAEVYRRHILHLPRRWSATPFPRPTSLFTLFQGRSAFGLDSSRSEVSETEVLDGVDQTEMCQFKDPFICSAVSSTLFIQFGGERLTASQQSKPSALKPHHHIQCNWVALKHWKTVSIMTNHIIVVILIISSHSMWTI